MPSSLFSRVPFWLNPVGVPGRQFLPSFLFLFILLLNEMTSSLMLKKNDAQLSCIVQENHCVVLFICLKVYKCF